MLTYVNDLTDAMYIHGWCNNPDNNPNTHMTCVMQLTECSKTEYN